LNLRPLITLFAKAPVPGRVKTRLGLPPEEAAALHSDLVRQTLVMLDALRPETDVELSSDEPTDAWREFRLARTIQAGGSLGDRIYAALSKGLAAGHPRAAVLGSDSPGLPPAHIRALLASPAEVAIGPTEDGGFYAIACLRIAPGMFGGVRWSTAFALDDTVAGARRCGLSVELGPPWFDVDRPEDLVRLPRPLAQP
jgi:rSAM/selenodomain-associated transferase 1